MAETIDGEDLRVGDVIEVWWPPRRDTVLALRPYEGPLKCLRGGQVATFAALPSGEMTIEPGSRHRRLARGGAE